MFQPCCCICDLLQESFTGLTALPSRFTVVAGTWTVASGNATTADDDALIAIDATVDGSDYGPNLLVWARATVNDGDAVLLIVCYTDANNWLGVRFRFSVKCTVWEFVKNSAGTQTILNTRTYSRSTSDGTHVFSSFPADARMWVGFDGDYLHASTHRSSPTLHRVLLDDFPSGTGAAIGTGDITGSVAFQDVYIYRFSTSCVNFALICLESQDGPYRTDAAGLGCGWDIVSGTWESVGGNWNGFPSPGFNSGYFYCNAPGLVVHPQKGLEARRISAYLHLGTFNHSSGDSGTGVARLIIAYQDTDNYLYLEVNYFTAFLGKRVAGVDSQVGVQTHVYSGGSNGSGVWVLEYDGTWLRGGPNYIYAYLPGFTGERAGIAWTAIDSGWGHSPFNNVTITCHDGLIYHTNPGACICNSSENVNNRMIVEIPEYLENWTCADCADLASTVVTTPKKGNEPVPPGQILAYRLGCVFYKKVALTTCLLQTMETWVYFEKSQDAFGFALPFDCDPTDTLDVRVDVLITQTNPDAPPDTISVLHRFRETISFADFETINNLEVPYAPPYPTLSGDGLKTNCHPPADSVYVSWGQV